MRRACRRQTTAARHAGTCGEGAGRTHRRPWIASVSGATESAATVFCQSEPGVPHSTAKCPWCTAETQAASGIMAATPQPDAERMTPLKTSFPKQDIRIVLFEGISQSAVEVFIAAGYEQVELLTKSLAGDEL